MKNALIATSEECYSYDGTLLGQRIAEVADAEFPVAPPLFWVECNDDVVADHWYWDGTNCVKKPEPPTITSEPDVKMTGTGGPNVIA